MKTIKNLDNSSHPLYKAILSLESPEECYEFFVDLCTRTEMAALEQRFDVARLLSEGNSYNDILEKTGASSATISRVNRALNYGTGGYAKLFSKIQEDQE